MDWLVAHPTLVIVAVFALLAFVLFESVRKLVFWIVKELNPHGVLAGYALTLLHHIFEAHLTVLRNFLPRNRVFLQLNRKRTSQTQEQ